MSAFYTLPKNQETSYTKSHISRHFFKNTVPINANYTQDTNYTIPRAVGKDNRG